jgi:uncharacterized repeat protein (TIGR01451 family)
MRLLLTFLLVLALQASGLGASLSTDSHSAQLGQVRTFTVVVTSDQPASAHINLVLPEGMTPISASMSNGACGSFGCNGLAKPGADLVLTESVRIGQATALGEAMITAIVTDQLQRSATSSLELNIRPNLLRIPIIRR